MKLISPLEERRTSGASYQLLSTLYYPPQETLTDTLDTLASLWAEWHPGLLPLIVEMQKMAEPDALLLKYSPLFLGPFKVLAPPYGSVYLEGKREVMGASTQDVNQVYQQAGLHLADTSKEAPDHIAIELEFMYYLIYRQCEEAEVGNLSTAQEWLTAQDSFLNRHLGAWIGQFADQIRQHAPAGFYRNLAEATVAFVQQDHRYITEIAFENQSVGE